MAARTKNMGQAASYYVYELADPRDGSVFYVGKGKGRRVGDHVRDVRRGRIGNAAKAARIREILAAGFAVDERITSWHDSEADAYACERRKIASMDGLTNMAGGVVPDAERAAERARWAIERIMPFERWELVATQRQREAAVTLDGSMRACYDKHCAYLRKFARGDFSGATQ